MKSAIITLAMFAAANLTAQSNQFQIQVAKDQALPTAFVLNTMDIMFSNSGSHYTDALDQAGSVSDPSFMYPYTIDSALTDIVSRDSRPELRTQFSIPFGVWTASSGEMHACGSWANPADSSLYTVTLIDNDNGATYNFYNEVTISVSTETDFTNRFTIVFTPKANYTGFTESCYGMNDGSVFAQSPQENWSVEMYHNSVYVNTFNVAGTDTLFAGLSQGSYDFVYLLDANIVDTATATVPGPAQVISSATPDNFTLAGGQAVTFTNTSSGATSYFWDFGDGNTSTDVDPSHAYSAVGFYTVTLTAYNITGCDNSSTYIIEVQSGFFPMQPNNPLDRNNNNTSTLRSADVTVKSENGNAEIAATNDVTISQFSVYGLNGQLVYTGSGNDNTFTYGTPGIYLIRILYTDGTAESKQYHLN